MKVLLLEDIQGTGKKGDIKDVADGFALNFLLPRLAAKRATDQVMADEERRVAAQERRNRRDLETRQKLSARLAGAYVHLTAKQNKSGALYAAISQQQIAKKISDELGVSIDAKQIHSKTPIKEVGEHQVTVTFGQGVQSVITVTVAAQ